VTPAPLEQNLTQYAAYHRDRRNIATHFVGVPMIVFAILLAAQTVPIPLGDANFTLAGLLWLVLSMYYVRFDMALGIAMAAVLFAMFAGANDLVARLGVGTALAWSLGIFVAGWILQFIGHKFEGLKPAFFDDIRQLFIGPLFVLAEAVFAFGGKSELRRYIEARVGPTVARRDGRALPLA
jgi:uncharacterized membrane protein YGL010W